MKSQKMSLIAATFLVLLHTCASNKSSSRPVYEVVNEQARIDDNIKISNSPGVLPYGNPLAGNSKQSAKIHITNQQAMYNAEKVRQHRAQLQRLAQGPKLDSYMLAYQESQDNHQLALEQQQATVRDNNGTSRTTARPHNIPPSRQKTNNAFKKRTQNIPHNSSRTPQGTNQKQEVSRKNHPPRKTEDNRSMKYRSQRSYGAYEYQQYLNPERYQFLYVDPKKEQNQGVSIKPNGNVGVAALETTESSKLYTEAIASDAKHVYPKQYSHMQNYKTFSDANSNSNILNNNGGISEFTSIQNTDTNDVPFDYYFYLKNPSHSAKELDDQTHAAHSGNTYASSYISNYNTKDHTPIAEVVDDVEDPNAQRPFIPQPSAAPTPQDETTTIRNHYYKIEVASQTLTARNKPEETKEVLYYKQEDSPSYPSLQYANTAVQTEDNNGIYLHHNTQHVGVQNISEDGVGVSSYGDDVSMNNFTKIRPKRASLDKGSFPLPDSKALDKTVASDTPISEQLVRLNPTAKKYNHNNFNVFVSPTIPLSNSDDDYLQGDDESDPSYDYYNDHLYDDIVNDDFGTNTNIRPLNNVDNNYSLDSRGNYAHSFKNFKFNPIYEMSKYHRQKHIRPAKHHNVYEPLSNNDRYNLPARYGVPRLNTLTNFDDILEPVYMITQSELRQLMNHQKLNIEHVDVFQIPKPHKSKRVSHFPKYSKRYPYTRYRNHKIRNKLHKINKFV